MDVTAMTRVFSGRASFMRLGAFWAALVASCIVATPARTEELPAIISPLQIVPDPNGLNLTTGKMTPPALTLSVPGSSRLKFDHTQNAVPRINGVEYFSPDLPADSQWSLHTADGVSESFRCSPGGAEMYCQSVTRSGSYLSGRGRTYRKAGSGELYEFNLVQVYSVPGGPNPNPRLTRRFFATRITYPDGEVIQYDYHRTDWNGVPNYRPLRVRSNLGYHITLTYAHDDLTQPGWTTPSEAALYKTGTSEVLLSKLTYNNNGTTTDHAGRVYTGFESRDFMGDMEVDRFSQTLPTEGSAHLVATQTNYQSGYQIIASINRDGVNWNYSYDNADYDLDMRGYEYDSVRVTGPNSYSRFYGITRMGNLQNTGVRNMVTSQRDELNRTTNYQYDNFLRLTRVTAPEGNYVTVGYDDAGNVMTKTSVAKSGSGLASLVEQSFTDLTSFQTAFGLQCTEPSCWRPNWYRDALNRQTDFTYNGRGQPTEQIDPADQHGVRKKTINEYQEVDTGFRHPITQAPELISRKTVTRTCGWHPSNPSLTTCGIVDHTRTEYLYWGNTFLPSRERRIDPATGEIRDTLYSYDDAGRLLSVDGPLAGTDDTQYFRYDLMGRKTWEIGGRATNGLHLAKRLHYRDPDDQVATVELGTLTGPTDTNLVVQERVDTIFDSRRNPVREVRSSGGTIYAVTDRSFLERGLPECSATRMNLSALPAATATGACTAGTVGGQGRDRISLNVYDSAGQLVQRREGTGGANEAAEVSYSYTSNGKRHYVIDANGNRAELQYDGHDRQVRWTLPSTTRPAAFNDATQATALSTAGAVNAGDYEQYTYDDVGNRTSFRKRDGSTLSYSYDGLNRMTVKVVPSRAGLAADQTRDVYYDYDLKGLTIKARFDGLGGEGITNEYNGFGELTSSRNSLSDLDRTLTHQYRADGNRIRLTHPDGVYFDLSYDALGRMNRATWTANGATTQFMAITYNARGLRSDINRASSYTGYDYDGLSRLSAMNQRFAGGAGNANLTFLHNPGGQIASETRDNDDYAWTGAVAVSRAYTANGLNQYTDAGPASFTYDANGNLTSDGSTSFVYDVENRLVSASGARAASLSYDPLGRLFAVTGPTTNTRFLYDGDKLAVEYDASGGIGWRYFFGPNVDEPIVADPGGQLACTNGTRFLHHNHQGLVVAPADCWGNRKTRKVLKDSGIQIAAENI